MSIVIFAFHLTIAQLGRLYPMWSPMIWSLMYGSSTSSVSQIMQSYEHWTQSYLFILLISMFWVWFTFPCLHLDSLNGSCNEPYLLLRRSASNVCHSHYVLICRQFVSAVWWRRWIGLCLAHSVLQSAKACLGRTLVYALVWSVVSLDCKIRSVCGQLVIC